MDFRRYTFHASDPRGMLGDFSRLQLPNTDLLIHSCCSIDRPEAVTHDLVYTSVILPRMPDPSEDNSPSAPLTILSPVELIHNLFCNSQVADYRAFLQQFHLYKSAGTHYTVSHGGRTRDGTSSFRGGTPRVRNMGWNLQALLRCIETPFLY